MSGRIKLHVLFIEKLDKPSEKEVPRSVSFNNHNTGRGTTASPGTLYVPSPTTVVPPSTMQPLPPPQNLPPRLQRKQMMDEEDRIKSNQAKYHVPYGGSGGGGRRDRTGTGGGAYDQRNDQQTEDQGVSRSNKHYDVNSRGTVGNRALWTDDVLESKGQNNRFVIAEVF